MFCKRYPSVRASYENLIIEVLNNGNEMITEDNQKCKEIRNVMVEITNPKLKGISKKYPLGKNAIEKYTNNLLYGSEQEFSYDYHERLFEYPNETKIKEINQIEFIINKLRKNINSRRAISITWNPFIDTNISKLDHGSVPCLQYIQFLIRDNKLYQTVLFRSNDLLLAYHANVLGLIKLGEMIANEVGVEYGNYTHHSVSMHIYVDRDKDYINKYFK